MLTEFNNQLSLMQNLMSRMDKHYTAREANYIKESKAPQKDVKPVLNESIGEEVSYAANRITTRDGKKLDKFYIDPKKTPRADTMNNNEYIKKHGGQWDKVYKMWYWWVPAEEGPERDARIQKILNFVEGMTKLETPNDPNNPRLPENVRAQVQKLLDEIDQILNTKIEGEGIDNFDEAGIKSKLADYKQRLLTITTSEDFKQIFEPVIKKMASGGYQYSIANTLLIMLQDPQATVVYAESKWLERGRQVVDKSHPIALWYPIRGKGRINPELKAQITAIYLNEIGKGSVKELTPNEKDELKRRLSSEKQVMGFKLTPKFFDIRFTQVIEGKEDLVATQDVMVNKPNKGLVWFDDKSPVTEESERMYNAIISTISNSSVKLEYVNDLGGARGVSKSGTIAILSSASHNIGTVQDLVHEFAHELLHQQYLKSKNNEFSNFFVSKNGGTSVIEQQAELTAWIVLRAFGYDAQTSINYVGNWGLNESNAAKIFDTVASAASFIIQNMHKNMNDTSAQQPETVNAGEETPDYGTGLNENTDMQQQGQGVVTGQEVADMVGMGDLYQRSEEMQQQEQPMFNGTMNELAVMIQEAVRKSLRSKMINEAKKSGLDWRTYANASRKWADHLMQHPDDPRRKSDIIGHQNSKGDHDIHTDNRLRKFKDAMTQAFNDEYGMNSIDSDEVEKNGLGVRKNGYYEMPFETDNIGAKGYYDHLSTETGTHRAKNHEHHTMEDQFDMPDVETGAHSSEPHRAYNKIGAFGRKRRYDMKPVDTKFDDGQYPYMKARNRGNQAIMDYQSGKSHYEPGKGWVNESIGNNPISKVWLFENPDGYYEFECLIEEGWVSLRGTYDGNTPELDDVVIGNGGHGHQVDPSQYEEEFNEIIPMLTKILNSKISRGDFESQDF